MVVAIEVSALSLEAREIAHAARRIGSHVLVTTAVLHLAAVAALHDDSQRDESRLRCAARLLGFVTARASALEWHLQYSDRMEHERAQRALENRLGADLEKLMSAGDDWSEDEAVTHALNI